MKVVVTAGPTREYIDTVRFITNASSGRMGYACAAAAVEAGHDVTLITGPVALAPPKGVRVVDILTVAGLSEALDVHFPGCDALVMAAAVGDFTVAEPAEAKIPRSGGRVRITLVPTPDLIAGLGKRRRKGQVLICFAVEDAADEKRARAEMKAKACDYVVVNTPAAMGQDESEACILSRKETVLPWERRPKEVLAREIVKLLG
ncbi:MAG: phosphopantothenoylcysteine decarboxylase domain-containing protein [Planctomycetota bacterium]|jgi:phosphopantothenoylcysteine decarboxylase/phosphopantothenate--cysteine ligase